MALSAQPPPRYRQTARVVLIAILLAPTLLVAALPVPTAHASVPTFCEVIPSFPSDFIKCCSCGTHGDTFFCRSGAVVGMFFCDLRGDICETTYRCRWMGPE